MAERERERDREFQREVDIDVDGDAIEDPIATSSSDTSASDRTRTRLRDRAGSILSVRALLLSLVLAVAGGFLVGRVVPLGLVGNLAGIVLAAFLYGVGSDVRHYVELTIAGALAGGASALLGNLVLSLAGIGFPLIVLGATGGGVAGLLGHYLGRDLRAGLTRDLQ